MIRKEKINTNLFEQMQVIQSDLRVHFSTASNQKPRVAASVLQTECYTTNHYCPNNYLRAACLLPYSCKILKSINYNAVNKTQLYFTKLFTSETYRKY